MKQEFWLYRWMDEYGVLRSSDISRLIRPGTRQVARLEEICHEVHMAPPAVQPSAGVNVLAGRGMDLSRDLDCCRGVRQQLQVDILLRKVLHYFDQVVVVGPSIHEYAQRFRKPDEQTFGEIRDYAEALLNIRKSGAEELFAFTNKPHLCESCPKERLDEPDVKIMMQEGRFWIEEFARSGSVSRLPECENHWHYTLRHPILEHDVRGYVDKKGDSRKPAIDEIATRAYTRYATRLVSDLRSANQLAVPLGITVDLHGRLLGRHGASVENVMLRLDLPILKSIAIADLVKLRTNEREHFERFRRALVEAFRERSAEENADSQTFATEIVSDIISPALLEIERKLRVARRNFERKARTSIGVGSLVTTAGLLTGNPLMTTAGVGIASTALAASHKYSDDKSGIELDDMYFLWKMESIQHGHTRRRMKMRQHGHTHR